MTATAPAPDRGTARPNRPRWLMLLAVLVVIGVSAAITAVIVNRNDNPANTNATAQLSQVQASCDDWNLVTDQQSARRPVVHGHVRLDERPVGRLDDGSTMWQGSEQLGKACHEWVSQNRAEAGTSGQQRCDDMVEWMDGHMSSRGGNWMMQGR